jgi:hypothetical protein
VGAAAILLALTGSLPLATAARGALVALALAAALHLLGRKGGAVPADAAIGLTDHRPLSRDAAVAILRVRGRALLVGYGAGGVRLLADLGSDVGADGGAPR